MTSRLAQMQMRYQQKQMEEKEKKLIKLYENQQQRTIEIVGRGSAGSNTSTRSIGTTGGGKVRQMFDERRQKAGIDKSYPLEPLQMKTATKESNLYRAKRSSQTHVTKTVGRNTISQVRSEKTVHIEVLNPKENNNCCVNTESDNTDNHAEEENIDEKDDNSHNDNSSNAKGINNNILVKTPKQVLKSKPSTNGEISRNVDDKIPSTARKPVAKYTPPRSSSSLSSASNNSSRTSPLNSANNMASRQASTGQTNRAPTNNRPSSKQVPKSPVVRDDLAECKFCGRRFATDRLGVHEDICGKTGKKKRRAYDATKHRVQGTELEGYVLKPGKKAGATNKISSSSKHSASKGNWRKTHEEFIAAIRAAKQAQAYVAKGGKLADLPPPPPSTNPDYVQCPHCGRRFNEAAAERHIPKCASYDFNKPKGGTQKGRPGRK